MIRVDVDEALAKPVACGVTWILDNAGTLMTRSVHDNQVLGYSVDIENAIIVIRTEFRECGEPCERTDVRFDGVVAYFLRDSLGGILNGIGEVSLDRILDEFADEFKKGAPYGWPWLPRQAKEGPHEYVASKGARAFEVVSSIGFDGFVIAKSMTVEPGEPYNLPN